MIDTKTDLSFGGVEIDDINRSARKQKQDTDLVKHWPNERTVTMGKVEYS